MEKLVDVMLLADIQSSLVKGEITISHVTTATALLGKYAEDKEMYETIVDLMNEINKFLTRSE